MDAPPAAFDAKMVSNAITEFTPDLFETLKKDHPGNLIFSPFSLSAVIAMLKAGAKGKTAEEIKAVMKFPDDASLNGGYKKLLESLKSNKDFSLEIANRIFVHDGFALKDSFVKSAKRYYQSEVMQLDFSEKEKSAKEINNWVEEKTKNRIKNLIFPDELTPLARLVLVNAIYFKGQWENKFMKYCTVKDRFYTGRSKAIQVDMMEQTDEFPYTEIPDLKVKAIALPYKGDKLSMVIVLPEKRTSLAHGEAGLKNFDLEEILKRLTEKTVNVFLPKFKMESKIELKEPLIQLGLRSMFRLDADFSGIPKTNEELFVEKVVQKAFIDVNENGTEAAAATMVGPVVGGMPPRPKKTFEFRADHPFIVYIIHSMKEGVKTNDITTSILFTGIFRGGESGN